MSAAQELQDTLAAVAGGAGAAVVGIGNRWGAGSGIVVAEGQVLTNAHNVGGEQVEVTFSDGRSAGATVAGSDVDGDVAVLHVDTGGVEPMGWSTASEVSLGTVVVALANPGGRGLRATMGTVSATEQPFRGPRGRRIAGSIEHTAPLRRGSSGGPVVDIDGRLLGINTSRRDDGFYLAIPADATLRQRVTALGRGESPQPRRLGVAILPAGDARRLRAAVGLPERDGLLVRDVAENSPADDAGLRRGDLIVAAGGRHVTTSDELFEVLDGLDAGTALALTVVRGSDEMDVAVTFSGVRQEGSV